MQIDELAFGLVAEVRRLRTLLDRRSLQSGTFDLSRAIAPVLTCARARRLDVRSSVGPGITVLGRAESTAQALLALLTNAERHAPGSPIEVRASTVAGAVLLHVDDRGPGVPRSHQERIFERSVQVVGGEGSGLGLFIARQLMEGQGGTISVEVRAGGGSSFVLRFDAPFPCQPPEPWLREAAPEPVPVGA
jgi:signal transduction histidine kinase